MLGADEGSVAPIQQVVPVDYLDTSSTALLNHISEVRVELRRSACDVQRLDAGTIPNNLRTITGVTYSMEPDMC